MGILAWIVLGLVAGVIARSVSRRRTKQVLVVSILVGVTGAVLGGWIAAAYLGIDAAQGFFDLTTWATAIVGSVLLLMIHHAISGGLLRPKPRWRVRR
ncbi:Putative membrane protein [Amycolatopsis japonica]|uniref:Putative membrane protein n=1 Tax=Amycolatopsis japonica TaxID=208439 RepID=A0A075UWE7_9PSEU|nr:GlsB/YeaQ/YmgE family stress response membrane protein [Amycolatopsis japonica]AIG78522.1 Putative membrane protein [Amycolatopsis japonica]